MEHDRTLQRLRHDAQTQDEWATKMLWHYFFDNFVFVEQQFFTYTELPPNLIQLGEASLRRIDMATVVNSDDGTRFVLMFSELKKGRATPFNIADVEMEALDAATQYMSISGAPAVYAMTAYGPFYRLWLFIAGQRKPIPVYPYSNENSNRESYCDLKYTWDALLEHLGLIKADPTPDADTANYFLDLAYAAEQQAAEAAEVLQAAELTQASLDAQAAHTRFNKLQNVDPADYNVVTITEVGVNSVHIKNKDITSRKVGANWITCRAGERVCYTYTGKSGAPYLAWKWPKK